MPGGARELPPCMLGQQSNARCQKAENWTPVVPLGGITSADPASSRTRSLEPAGEGSPTTALTAASSDPSPFGPHPVAPGTVNVSSPCTAPVLTSVVSGPTRLGTPFTPKGSKSPAWWICACERSVFTG